MTTSPASGVPSLSSITSAIDALVRLLRDEPGGRLPAAVVAHAARCSSCDPGDVCETLIMLELDPVLAETARRMLIILALAKKNNVLPLFS